MIVSVWVGKKIRLRFFPIPPSKCSTKVPTKYKTSVYVLTLDRDLPSKK